MNELEILDHEKEEQNIDDKLKKKERQLVRIGLILGAINTILWTIFVDGMGNYILKFIQGLFTNFVFCPLLGAFLGIVVALFPFLGLPYSRKYFRAVLLSIIAIQTFLVLSNLGHVLMYFEN